MSAYLIRRIIQMVFVLLISSAVIYGLLLVAPGEEERLQRRADRADGEAPRTAPSQAPAVRGLAGRR